jgi:hypothetical protein
MTARVYRPRPVNVRVGADGKPEAVGRMAVEAIREEWLVEDRWWTGRRLRRCYLELVTADGANRVVFRDFESGRWFAQRGA